MLSFPLSTQNIRIPLLKAFFVGMADTVLSTSRVVEEITSTTSTPSLLAIEQSQCFLQLCWQCGLKCLLHCVEMLCEHQELRRHAQSQTKWLHKVFQENSGHRHLPDKPFLHYLFELKHLHFAFIALQQSGYYPDFHPRYFHNLPCNSRFPGRTADYWRWNGTRPSTCARGYRATAPNQFRGAHEDLTLWKSSLFLFWILPQCKTNYPPLMNEMWTRKF